MDKTLSSRFQRRDFANQAHLLCAVCRNNTSIQADWKLSATLCLVYYIFPPVFQQAGCNIYAPPTLSAMFKMHETEMFLCFVQYVCCKTWLSKTLQRNYWFTVFVYCLSPSVLPKDKHCLQLCDKISVKWWVKMTVCVSLPPLHLGKIHSHQSVGHGLLVQVATVSPDEGWHVIT